MRVLQLGMGWFPDQAGGLNRFYYELVEALAAQDTVFGIVAANSLDEMAKRLRVASCCRRDANLLTRMMSFRRATREVLRRENIDIVSSHFALYTYPCLDVAASKPLVVHFQGPWGAEGKAEGHTHFSVGLKERIEASVYKRAKRYIVLSNAFREILIQRFLVDPERVHVIPPAINHDRFALNMSRPDARIRLGWPRDRPVALIVRRLAKRMGLENAIAAMRAVSRSVPDALLMVAGKGPLAEELHALVQEYGLEANVTLLGYLPDDQLPIAYRGSDFSVVPTVALEGFGLVTLESLSSGTPVLVTPIGGLPEAVAPLSPALVMGGAGIPELTEALASAFQAPEKLPSADACSRYARERFSWPRITARVRKVYAEAIAT